MSEDIQGAPADKRDEPFVSVVTPFHNTDDYLAECIDSVLAQTYHNFEYILDDNMSTDTSAEIARSYAAKDDRIKLVRTDRLLQQRENFNFALSHISRESRYCKLVLADDWIYPRCIEEMVRVADQHPDIGLVCSYRKVGLDIHGGGLEPDVEFLPGREAGRRHLLGPLFVFGTPTSVLYRSDLVRKRAEFFAPYLFQADVDTSYDLLSESDFGFVHQMLSFSRDVPGSISGSRDRFNAEILTI